MSTPPDFLGMALGMIQQRRQREAQAQEQAQRARAMQMDQQRFGMEQERFAAGMRATEEAEKQDTLKLAIELGTQGYDFNSIMGLVGDKLPESYRPFVKEVVKKQKEKEQIPSEAAQADIATGAAAAAGGQQDPRLAALSVLRALPQMPPGLAPLSNQMAARAGGIAAENARERGEFEGRTRFGTNESLRQFAGQQSYQNRRDNVSLVIPPEAAAVAQKYGVRPGLVNLVGRDKANALITESGGIIREIPMSVTGGKLSDVQAAPAATRGKLYDQLSAIGEQRRTMQRIGDNYDPHYTEYLGQAEAGLNKFTTKLGIRTSEERQEFAAGYNSFKADLGNNLMAKIQERAATTFTDRLYDRMRKWNLTEDLSDPEFRRLYKEISRELDLNHARTIYALKHDPLAAAEAEESGELSMKTRNALENRYTDGRLNKMMRTTEQRAIAGAIRSGASDDEALRAGQEAVEREYFTPQPGAQ